MKLYLRRYRHTIIAGLATGCLWLHAQILQAQTNHRNVVINKVVGSDSSNVVTQNTDSMRLAAIKTYYALAMRYKNGDGVAMDYGKAFDYFSQAAALGDAQSVYAKAYLFYKGLGTTQDYTTAAALFAQGAYENRDNSMYFYGLCLRNGYGVFQNEDSAQYWLKKSAALGYKQAALELQSKAPENDNAQATQLVQKIHNAAVPQQIPLNRFVAVQPQTPDSTVIAGAYEGYVIQYDWSGQHPVSTKPLHLLLEQNNSSGNSISFTGKWMEAGTDTVNIRTFFTKDSLVFADTHYGRKDHYSLSRAIRYDFRNAALNLVRQGDSVYLAGNIFMFSPDRKEPSKPLFVALTRTDNPSSSLIKTQTGNNVGDSANTAAAKILSVYPNPFTSYVNVAFLVNRAGNVGVELYDMAGRKVYDKPAQFLNAGKYAIRVEPFSLLPAQAYVLRLVFKGGVESVGIIKK